MKFKHSIQAGIVALCATIAGVSCTDTWDEHYSVYSSSVAGVSLWDLIGQDESLTNFKRVLDSCDFDRILGSAWKSIIRNMTFIHSKKSVPLWKVRHWMK